MNRSSASRSNVAPAARAPRSRCPGAAAAALWLAVLAVPLGALSAPAGAPAAVSDAEASDELLEDDVRFAEDLARHRYFSLAMDVLDGVAAGSLSNDLSGRVTFTRGRVFKRASESTADPTARLELLDKAVEQLGEWALPAGPYAFHDRRVDALEDLAEVLHERARLRAQTWDEGGRTDARLRAAAAADFKEADAVYNSLLRECETRAEQLDDREGSDEAAALRERGALSYYYRGRNAIFWAEVEDDREFRLERATELLLEFQWEAEPGTISLLYAMHFEAIANARLGRVEEALEQHANVIDEGRDLFWSHLADFGDSARAIVTELMDLAWGALATLQAESGDVEAGMATIATMRREHDAHEQPFGRTGFTVLLDWADLLAASGRTREATELYKLVAEQGSSFPAGELARGKLAEAVSSGSVTETSPGVLVAAGEGFYQDKKYDQAAYTFQLAVAGLGTPAERERHEIEAWIGVAKSLDRARRYLEAAIAYERLLDLALRDESTRNVAETAAVRLYEMYRRRYVETGDAFDKGLRDEANKRLEELGVLEDVAFTQAKEQFDDARTEAEYRATLESFESVAESAPSYERAIVYAGRSLAGAGDHDAALARFDAMIGRAADPALEPTNAEARGRRETALAEALFYKAQLLLDDAVARPDEALALLDGFETRLPTQRGFFELVKYLRVLAHAMAGRPDAAEAALADLAAFDESSRYLAHATFEVATAHLTASEALRAGGDAPAADERLERAAEHMWRFCQLDGFQRFNNVLTTGDWFMAVDRCEDAELAYDTALKVFDGRLPDAELDLARLGLATSLDCQDKFGRSRPFWTDLVARNRRDRVILRGAARSLGGWLETDDAGRVVEVPGAGEYQEAFGLWLELYKGINQTNKYERLWWEAKLGTIYTKYRQGASNQQAFIDARKVLDNQRLSTPEYDKSTVESLAPELRYEDLLEKYFRYLDRNLPAE